MHLAMIQNKDHLSTYRISIIKIKMVFIFEMEYLCW